MNPRNFHLSSMPLILFLSIATSGWAQSSATPQPGKVGLAYWGLGYFFVAPGIYSGYSDSIGTLHIGGGGEALVYRGLAVGAEVGCIAALQGSGGGMGLFSANGSYYFSRQRKVSPFLTGGYSSVWGHGQRNLVNLGAGANYWIRERLGIRFELRDHIYAAGSDGHLLGFRIGIIFR
jgi:hypothetical protein